MCADFDRDGFSAVNTFFGTSKEIRDGVNTNSDEIGAIRGSGVKTKNNRIGVGAGTGSTNDHSDGLNTRNQSGTIYSSIVTTKQIFQVGDRKRNVNKRKRNSDEDNDDDDEVKHYDEDNDCDDDEDGRTTAIEDHKHNLLKNPKETTEQTKKMTKKKKKGKKERQKMAKLLQDDPQDIDKVHEDTQTKSSTDTESAINLDTTASGALGIDAAVTATNATSTNSSCVDNDNIEQKHRKKKIKKRSKQKNIRKDNRAIKPEHLILGSKEYRGRPLTPETRSKMNL